ncbi:MAG: hypothetical protein ABIO95_00715 [Bdellovibrionota bacterium]
MKPLEISEFKGPLEEFLRKTDPHTEAAPASLAIQFMVAFGNCIGRLPYVATEADHHFGNLFAVVVGQSSKGRKGTSWGHVKRFFKLVDSTWVDECVGSGLSSGEGLCASLMAKEGCPAPDSRRLIVESEFAGMLRRQEREGNTLSAVVRNAWDTGDLNVLTRKDPISVKGAHISILGHITKVELSQTFRAVQIANGFGNRFLWVSVGRSKLLPRGGDIESVDFSDLIYKVRRALQFARQVSKVERSEEALEMWDIIYREQAIEKEGVVGLLISRSEPQILRLAMLFALLDCSYMIEAKHLWAGYSLWKFCEDSVEDIFGGLIDPKIQRLMDEIKKSEQRGLSRSDIHKLFGNHLTCEKLEQMTEELLGKGFRWIVVQGQGKSLQRLVSQ